MNVERQMAILVNHHRHQMLNRENCNIDSGVVFPEKVGNLQDETCYKEWMRNSLHTRRNSFIHPLATP
jgi:hypothetical protein